MLPRVGAEWDCPLAVSVDMMEMQVKMMLKLGYAPATFSDALLNPSAERSFAVTFDDAYRSLLRRALPVLTRLGVPATVFVPTGWAGPEHRQAAWEDMGPWLGADGEPEAEVMDWDELRTLRDAGWEIGSHTVTHPRLTRTTDEQLERELTESRAVVERETGVPCRSIAYPFGDLDDRVIAATRAARLPRRRRARRAGVRPPPHAVDAAELAAPGGLPARRRAALRRQARDDQARHQRPGPPAPRRRHRAGPRARPAPGGPPPRIAVVIPCYNDGILAKEAVASVREDEPVEVVVVDDASTDPDTAKALDELRAEGVTVIRHEVNQRLSAARRTGLAHTTAPYVFPLDSDDLLVPGALAQLADRLDAHPEAAATWAAHQFGDRHRQYGLPLELEGYRVTFRNDYPVCSMFRRTALEQVGAWQDVGGMVGYEDWNLWMTLAERRMVGLHAGHGVLAVRRRLHGPRMLGDSVTRHRRLYAELRRTHPQLFADRRRNFRTSALPLPKRIAYPLLFGGRPPLGIRSTAWALAERVRGAAGRGGK